MKLKNILLSTFTMVFLSACSSSMFLGYEEDNQNKLSIIDTKNCDFSEIKDIELDDNQEIKKIKDTIYNGNFYAYRSFLCQNYKESLKAFDLVEDSYKNDVDEANIFKIIGINIMHTIVNDNITDYYGQFYERMLVNTYKAINYMALNDYEAAGVEVKRALDRQRRNKEEFQSYIIKNLNNLSQKRENSEVDQMLNMVHTPVYKAYANYSNPFVSYVAGLFYMLDGRSNNAIDLFKEVYAQEKQMAVLQDYYLARTSFNARKIPYKFRKNMQISKNGRYIWVIYENGKVRPFKEFNLNIPIVWIEKDENKIDYKILLGNNKASDFINKIAVTSLVFSIAVLGDSQDSYPYILANNQQTQLLSSMDNVVTAEYKATLKTRIAKSFIRAISKAALSVAANKEDLLAGASVNILNNVLNHSDVRYFVGLPKNYQVIRLVNNGSVELKTPDGQIISNQSLNPNKNYLIFIKSSVKGVNYTNIIEGR